MSRRAYRYRGPFWQLLRESGFILLVALAAAMLFAAWRFAVVPAPRSPAAVTRTTTDLPQDDAAADPARLPSPPSTAASPPAAATPAPPRASAAVAGDRATSAPEGAARAGGKASRTATAPRVSTPERRRAPAIAPATAARRARAASPSRAEPARNAPEPEPSALPDDGSDFAVRWNRASH